MKHPRSRRRKKCEWMNTTKLIMNETVKKNERNNLSPSHYTINDSSLIYFIYFLKYHIYFLSSLLIRHYGIDCDLLSWPEIAVKFHEISMRNTFMLPMKSFQCVQLLVCIKSVLFVNWNMLNTTYWEFPFICVNLNI